MISHQSAELIAIKGLQYLAGDPEQLSRFLALSGCEPHELRQNADSPEFLAGVLEFFMGNEPTLLAFCADHTINPDDIGKAQQCLGGPGEYEAENSPEHEDSGL